MSAWMWFWIGAGSLCVGALFAILAWSAREATRGGVEEASGRRNGIGGAVGRVLDNAEAHAVSAMAPAAIGFSIVTLACIMWVYETRGHERLSWIDAVLGLALASFFRWIFGVVAPAAVAEHGANACVLRWAWLMRPVHIAMAPLSAVSTGLHEMIRRLLGGRAPGEEHHEELLSVIDEGEREGHIDENERDMIEAVVEFRSQRIEEIMTPRTEVHALAYTDDLEVVKAFMREVGHSRIPVYEDNLDHIVGILYAKDLLRWMSGDGNSDFILREVVRAPEFVPETKTVRELLAELLARRVHLAVVTDEYGGTAGVVTIEDIVEEVFGEIHDEFEEAQEPSPVVDPDGRSAEIEGRTSIDDANDTLEPIGIELPEGEEYDTVGGMIMAMLGHIPTRGETVRRDGFVLTVLEAAPTRVNRVRVEAAPEEGAKPVGEPAPA